jgi:nucleoside-diphosphate-sugar epimerase
MRVLVIGATGVLGRPAVRKLLADGHSVTGLARDDDRAAVVAAQGATPAVADLFDPESLAAVLPGHEAVLNLATRIPPPGKALLGRWAENDRVRTDGSAALVAAALASDDVRVIVQEGVTFYYADGGDAEITEESPIDVPAPLRSSVAAHANVARFAEAAGRVGVRLRIAMLLGDDPLTRAQLRGAKYGMPLVYGDRAGWTAVVHPSDAAAGAVAALSAPSGIYNVAAPPLRKRDLGAALAALAGVRRARAVPAGLLKLMGPVAAFGRSHRVVSTKLTEATGWQPALRVPSPAWLREG